MRALRLKKHRYAGKLIVFEGVDGSGKTTLLNLAKDYFQSVGQKVISTKMPSDRIRKMSIFNDYDNSKDGTTRKLINLADLTIMVCGDRLIVLDEEIIPALEKGYIVLCDRYCFTGYVRCNEKIIYQISNRFIKPDLTIYAYANAEKLKERVLSRELEKNNFYDDVGVTEQIRHFNFLAKKNYFKIIDTTKSQSEINRNLKKYLKFKN